MSEITILAFGKLTDILPQKMQFPWTGGTLADLKENLETAYPEIAGKTFQVAVNQAIVPLTTTVVPGAEIALLPPFSGG